MSRDRQALVRSRAAERERQMIVDIRNEASKRHSKVAFDALDNGQIADIMATVLCRHIEDMREDLLERLLKAFTDVL